MATVFDVAAYILDKQGKMTVMKLQKLVYYAQAWSLVWVESPLFKNPIQAWANGPVCPDLYAAHRGLFEIDLKGLKKKGNADNLTPDQEDVIDRVLAHYGSKPGHWLSKLTHAESPWKNAREGIPAGERSEKEITHSEMAEYYSSL